MVSKRKRENIKGNNLSPLNLTYIYVLRVFNFPVNGQ